MANICSYTMRAKGSANALNALVAFVEKCSDGRVSELNSDTIQISGSCKWSIFSSFRTRRFTDKTIEEVVAENNLQLEAISEESGCEMAEHLWLEGDEILADEVTDYHETYNEETDDWESEGGYSDMQWAF